jgi:ferric-dicitrate binding protein FerR (iron transport regulator)
MKDEADIERMLKAFTGPRPRPETLRAILARVREEREDGRENAAIHAGRTRRLLRYVLPFAVAASIALGIGLSQAFVLTEKRVPIGRAESTGLLVARGGSEEEVQPGSSLFAGDTVTARTRADLTLADGSGVRLGQETCLTLGNPQPDERFRLALTRGQLFLRVAKAPGCFRVEASGATVEVLGTVFGVEVIAQGASASVYEGRVRLASPAGQIELGRGESGRTQGTAPPVRTDAKQIGRAHV